MKKLISRAGAAGIATAMVLSSGVLAAASAQNDVYYNGRLLNGSTSSNRCYNNRWQNFTTGNNSIRRFSNQDQCLSYFGNGTRVNGVSINDNFINNGNRSRIINFLIQLRDAINNFLRTQVY